jgi:hypothetical protein
MYASDMLNEKGKPDLTRARLMTEQVKMQRAVVQAQTSEKMMAIPTRTPSPVPSDDDDEMTVDQKRAEWHSKKMAKSGNGRAGGQTTGRCAGK